MPRRSTFLPASGKPSTKSESRGRGAKTPMMEQFWRAKKEQPDALLFFRMGDFYELFGEDAHTAGRELGITVTSRDKGKGKDALPMAGVPVKAVDGYLMRLVRKGFKVAICEQLTDPKKSKGIVERGIVRVVTPGTITEEDALDARANNYLAGLHVEPSGKAGIAWVDLSTGRFHVAESEVARVSDELARIGPAELLVAPESLASAPNAMADLERSLGQRITERDAWRFDERATREALLGHFRVKTLAGFGIEDDSPAVPAAGALVEYLQETQKTACEHIRRLERIEPGDHLVLDRATRSCLELVQTQRGERREGTLLDVLDGSLTAMGGRLMREWLLAPLRTVSAITYRQQAVAELVDGPFLRDELRERLRDVLDVERLVAKVATGRANGRDLCALASSIEQVPALRDGLTNVYSQALADLRDELDPLEDMVRSVRETLVDDPPLTIKEGGLVRDGVNAELDELRQIAGDGKSWMARFQSEESERTGIQGLRIGFNSVFGYFLEVPRAQVGQVPEAWIRKQTVKNAERYITPELKEFESKVLKSEETSKELEYTIFGELRDAVAGDIARILDTARALARLDVLAGLAQRASDNRYVAPTIDDGPLIEIREGRHPVIERSPICDTFVPNDARLDLDGEHLQILTGPNMAGKSTYIRQVALIVLLAQIGSYVPADSAHVGVVDRVFTRVGAGDDISRGESTFMVEMVEIANILNNASNRSLVILDEVGRGTSTFDGLALAWAIVEHLHETVGARTLFATHYHQLTDLASRQGGVANLHVAVREVGDEILFLHKIVAGGTDRSYGIHVARLAGVPHELVERAWEILRDLERDEEDLATRIAEKAPSAAQRNDEPQQLTLFAHAPSPIEEALLELDVDELTPLAALNLLAEWKSTL